MSRSNFQNCPVREKLGNRRLYPGVRMLPDGGWNTSRNVHVDAFKVHPGDPVGEREERMPGSSARKFPDAAEWARVRRAFSTESHVPRDVAGMREEYFLITADLHSTCGD